MSPDNGTSPGAWRRKARELALQALYAIDVSREPPESSLEAVLRESHAEGEERDYAQQLVQGTLESRPELDALLTRWSQSWSLRRMAAVDRNLLRLAAYELLHRPEVPRKVVINEAVEIAKRFGDQKSPAFVNAILDKIGREAAPASPRDLLPPSAESAPEGEDP